MPTTDAVDRKALNRVAAALEKCGLELCADTDPIADADDLARRVEVAARNRAAGRRKRDRFRDDNDTTLAQRAARDYFE